MAAVISAREASVLHLSAWGYSNKEIADRLGISVKTVEAHKWGGMHKLKLTDRVGLVQHAVQAGWLRPGHEPNDPSSV